MGWGRRLGHFCLACAPAPPGCRATRGFEALPGASAALFSPGVSVPRRSRRAALALSAPAPFQGSHSRAPIPSPSFKRSSKAGRGHRGGSQSCGLPGDPTEPSAAVTLIPGTLLRSARPTLRRPVMGPEFSRTVLPRSRPGPLGSAQGRMRVTARRPGMAALDPHWSPFSSLRSPGRGPLEDQFGCRYPSPTPNGN